MTAPLDRAALEALAVVLDKATKGEWEWSELGQYMTRDGDDDAPSLLVRDPLFGILSCDGPSNGPSAENAAAIVALHNAAPALLAMAMRALEMEAALDGINLQCICHLTTPQMCAGCVARAALAKGRQP